MLEAARRYDLVGGIWLSGGDARERVLFMRAPTRAQRGFPAPAPSSHRELGWAIFGLA